MLVPMLDEAVELAAESGAHEVLIGIAHRGRLNVLTHVVGRSYTTILREFEGERSIDALIADPEGGTGDVKYHLAASESRVTAAGEIQVIGRVESRAISRRSTRSSKGSRARSRPIGRAPRGSTIRRSRLPVLIHGDASFAGQGVVAETFNLHSLDGYSTGGTLHLIANNQVGFTTDPAEGRSTRYSSDLAKGFDVPIVHVNADDPGGCRVSDPARPRVPRGVRARRRRRPRRLPALRPQRAGRGRVHATAADRAHRAAGPGARVVRASDSWPTASCSRTRRRTCSSTRSRSCAPRTTSSGRASTHRYRPAEIPTRTDTGAAVMTAVAADRLVQLGEQLLAGAGRASR